MDKQEQEYKPVYTPKVVETPGERHKRHMHRRRTAIATGFALGFLAAVGIAALIILFSPVGAAALAGLTAKLTVAGIITGSGLITGLLGGKVSSNVVSDRIEKEDAAIGLNPEMALANLGQETIKDVKKGISTLEDVIDGKQEKSEKKADKISAKSAGSYTQMLEQQRAE